MLKKDENMAKLGATLPLKQMISYEWCMKVGAMLNPPLQWIEDLKKDKKCGVAEERIAQRIWEKLLVGVVNEMEMGLMDLERVKGLAKVNKEGWEWWADGWKLKHI